jgi:hypothetical protein
MMDRKLLRERCDKEKPMSKKRLHIAIAAIASAICVIGPAVFAASQNFQPDVVFKWSSFTGWHKLGQADWRADNGKIIFWNKMHSAKGGATKK